LHISQLLVYARGDATSNAARGKAVTGSVAATQGAYQKITDGELSNRSWQQGLCINGVNSWVRVDLSSATDIQRVVVIMPNGKHDWPITNKYTLQLLNTTGQFTLYTCDFDKAMRCGTNNGTYTFDFDVLIVAAVP